MKWPWGTKITKDQRKESAKFLLNLCQGIALGILLAQFVPGLGVKLSKSDLTSGFFLSAGLYLIAMRLLRGGEVL